MNNTTTETTVAETILNQINAADSWARARWGVKMILTDNDSPTPGLMFNCTKGIKIQVKLVADTYSIEIGRLRGLDYTKKAELDGVYAEDLTRVIDSMFSKAFGRL